MKKYENPEMNVLAFEVEDVVTTSGGIGGGIGGDNETEMD